MIQNKVELESIIVCGALVEIISTHDKVFIGFLDLILKEVTTFESYKLIGKLTCKELEDLNAKVNFVLKNIRQIPIDYIAVVKS